MRKLRLMLSVAVAALAVSACSPSPTGLEDCPPDQESCEEDETIKPTVGT